jgi:hypothetical protein
LEREAVAVMLHLNRDASVAMLASGATASTDVTGYGLIGHLSNIAGGADIDLRSIPLMDGVRALAERDLFSGGSRRNHAAYKDQVDWGGSSELDQMILCDAQTSGGLLVAIPFVQACAQNERSSGQAQRCTARLEARHDPSPRWSTRWMNVQATRFCRWRKRAFERFALDLATARSEITAQLGN